MKQRSAGRTEGWVFVCLGTSRHEQGGAFRARAPGRRPQGIFPPKVHPLSSRGGLPSLAPGQIVYCVMSENSTNEPHRLIASSVGIAVPKDDSKYGYLSEHHSFGETDQKAGAYAEDLAAELLATVLGVEFDPNKSYDERKDTWKLSNEN